MKKKLFLALAMSIILVCLFAIGISATSVTTETEVTLADGTTVPLYDENGEGLIWFVVSTDENGVNTYSSVAADDNTADNATNYVTYSITSTYGTNQMHDIYIKYWDAETSAYVSYNEGSIVVMNLRTFAKEYWSIGSGWSSTNLEYVYHSATARNSGDFTDFNKLQILDASLTTNFESFSEQAFKNCTALREVRIGNSETGYGFTCTNGNLFNGATSLTTIWMADPSDVTSICGKAFYNCNALTGTYTFPNVTTIGTEAFRYAATNEDTALILNFPSVKTLGGSSGDTHVFSNSGVTELTFGDDIETMSFNTFTNCTRLWRIEFDGVAEGFNFPSYTFDNCSALMAFSIPEGVTTLPSRMFKSCSSLTAIYLPSTLTTINSGSQDHATFANCTNAYFVSSPFKYTSEADIPSKPDVYYFPSGITSIASGEVFKQCRNLNKTLVFPVGVTSISNAWTFEAGISNPTLENIVFLGDMVNINTSSWKLTGKIYFANANDKSSSDFETYTNTKSTVFCNAEGNTTHLEEKEVTLGATYLDNAKTEKLCFCGHAIETTEVEDTALFTVKGYSTDGTSIVFTIVANTDAIDAYNTVNGKNVKYGIVASKLQEDGALINKDGTIANDSVLSADFTGTQYTMLQIKIVGAASAPSTSLHCCAYVTDGTSVAYLYEEDKKATQGETANQVSYSQLAPDEQQ